MTHNPKVVETKELSDEQVAYRVRCCDEKMTDSWITLSVSIADHTPQVEEFKQTVADRHEKKLQWRAKQQSAVSATTVTPSTPSTQP